MTDLSALAEAAKAATAAHIADPTDRDTGRQWDRACAEFSLACTEDAILALIRERDEALTLAVDLEQANRREHVERAASLASYKEEVERLLAAMDREEAYLHRMIDASEENGGIMHGDLEGAFHRIRAGGEPGQLIGLGVDV